MRKALASVVIVAFAGLMCVGLLAVFNGTNLSKHYLSRYTSHYPYFTTY